MSVAENIPPTPMRAVDAFFFLASNLNILFDGLKSGLPDKPPSKLVGFFKVFEFTPHSTGRPFMEFKKNAKDFTASQLPAGSDPMKFPLIFL